MARYCQTLDLKNDANLIEEYKKHHQQVWPEVKSFIHASGILSMEIYRYKTRLVMVMETTDQFSFDKMAELAKDNLKVQEWETLMSKFQQPLSGAREGEKWALMERIY